MSERIIDLLINYELSVSKLYAECSVAFPELKEFWETLSEEEIEHAENIRHLTDTALKGGAIVNEKAFAIRPLEISIEYSKEVTDRVIGKELDLLGVLSLAYDIENSLIESEYYKVFIGKNVEANAFIRDIHMESKSHRERVKIKKEDILRDIEAKKLERWD